MTRPAFWLAGSATLCGLLALAWIASPARAAARDEPKTVLIVYGRSSPARRFVELEESLRATVEARSARPVRFDTEHLEISDDGKCTHEPELLALLRKRYSHWKPDLVIAGRISACFVLEHRDRLFPGVPVMLLGFEQHELAARRLGPGVTAAYFSFDWAATLDAALRLHPDTQQVVVVNGSSTSDRYWAARARERLSPYGDRVDLRYLTALPADQSRAVLAGLPDRSLVLVGPIMAMRDGPGSAGDGEIRRLILASPRPVYGLIERFLGDGIVGGRLASPQRFGVEVGELALRILNGETLGLKDAVEYSGGDWAFDARQLERWRLNERLLPSGSIVHFRGPLLWDLYRWHIIGGGATIVVGSLLTAGLLLERQRRRQAQRVVTEYHRFEQFLQDVAAVLDSVPASELDREIEHALAQCLDVLGLDRAALAEFTADRRAVRITHACTRPGVEPVPGVLEADRFPWMAARLFRGEAVTFARSDELPGEAETDRQSFRAFGTRSLAAVPVTVHGAVCGTLRFSTTRFECAWSDRLVQQLHLLAEAFGGALGRRRAEETIHEVEQRFRSLADRSPVMMWLTDSDGRASFVNAEWMTFTGQTMEQAVGSGWSEAVHPDDRHASLETYLDAFRARGNFRMEYRLRRADGEYRWVLDTGAARHAPDGTFIGYIGTCVDVTEVKEARHALAESMEIRSAIFGALYGKIAALDAKGVIIAVNEAWTRPATESGAAASRAWVGVDYLDVCRKAVGDIDAERALEAIESVLQGRATRASLEYRCPGPAEERWFEMLVEPLRRPEGGAVVSHIDITARRRAEEEVRLQRDELAHTLRLTTLGEMTASLSHEMNQPLAAIMASAQASLRLLNRPQPSLPDVREALDDIVADSRRASQVIQRLYALFRKDRSERSPIAINELVTDVAGVVRRDAERRRVDMHLVLADGLPPVQADAVQIQQVVLNLLVNAIEAMAGVAGPRELTLETVRREAGIVEVGVRDTGVGVEASQMERIFEPFVSSKAQGLGMGLSISRSIVWAHEGRIWATPNAGPGITVHVELPCEDPT